jgi:hypothetical protein
MDANPSEIKRAKNGNDEYDFLDESQHGVSFGSSNFPSLAQVGKRGKVDQSWR